MLKAERINIIEKHLNETGYASSVELQELTSASKATVRRDLISMAKAGKISLTHGGAVSMLRNLSAEESYQKKTTSNADEKNRIAEFAAGLINPGSKVIIDSGTTTLMLVQYIRKIPDLTVITNDVNIAYRLYDSSNTKIILIGGSIRPGYYTAIGSTAENQVKSLTADLCIIGTDSISEKGISIANINERGIKTSIVESANQVVVLADHSKFGKNSFANVCPLDDIDIVVTGRESEKASSVKKIASVCNVFFA